MASNTANLSLNGNFNSPVELKQSLYVGGSASFDSNLSIGTGSYTTGNHAFTVGEACSSTGAYSVAIGKKSISQSRNGDGNYHSYANGVECSSYGSNSYALGYRASTNKTMDGSRAERTFVWQGANNQGPYYSKGDGTFCIRPWANINTESTSSNPICAFFIGDRCITEYISSESAKRILTNENNFIAAQTFDAPVVFNDTTEFNGANTFYGSLSVMGSSKVDGDVNITDNPKLDEGIASHGFATLMALSAISSMGQYYDEDIRNVDFEKLAGFATSLGFVESYVISALEDTESFYHGEEGPRSAATREYALSYATSASTYMRGVDNLFTGINTFSNEVRISDRGKLSTTSTETVVDLRLGDVLVHNSDIKDTPSVTAPATEAYAASVASSGVAQILDHGNEYTAQSAGDSNSYRIKSSFYSPVDIHSQLNLVKNSTADFREGTLLLKDPDIKSSLENEPATTHFSRSVATSAVDYLLANGGTFGKLSKLYFKGDSTFDGNIYVPTQEVGTSSKLAASTEFVSKSIATSADAVRSLMLNGKLSGGGDAGENVFTNTNKFLGDAEIYVKTMHADCADEHAASCEWVKNILGAFSIFDLFDMKFMDYRLSQSRGVPWVLQGTTISKIDYPNAYEMILTERHASTTSIVQKKIGKPAIQVSWFQSNNGHRIITDSSVADKLYDTFGISWFYVLNENEGTITLPRTKYAFDFKIPDKNNEVGDYIIPTIPVHHHSVSISYSSSADDGPNPHHGGGACGHGGTFGSSGPAVDSPTVNLGATVQPPATALLLYFYCT